MVTILITRTAAKISPGAAVPRGMRVFFSPRRAGWRSGISS